MLVVRIIIVNRRRLSNQEDDSTLNTNNNMNKACTLLVVLCHCRHATAFQFPNLFGGAKKAASAPPSLAVPSPIASMVRTTLLVA